MKPTATLEKLEPDVSFLLDKHPSQFPRVHGDIKVRKSTTAPGAPDP